MSALARFLQRRFISTQSFHHDRHPIFQASSGHSSINAILNRCGILKRGVSTQTNLNQNICEDVKISEADTLKSGVNNVPTSMSITEDSAIKDSAGFSVKVSSRHDLAMVFTCKVCETRSVKTFCRESYEKGVVIARCGGCNNLHLIADHRGWFGETGTVEDFLAAHGEEVKRGSIDTLNATFEDIAGKQSPKGTISPNI